VVRESESPTGGNSAPMMTRDDWKRMEKELIKTALERSEGKVFGNGGAAEILKMNPTTLLSRMKALGLKSKVSS
jgi:transcriptional regulator with GAF, ATPase, and Fis domain